MPLTLPHALPSSMMEPRQSTTVPNVSKTSALGMTVGLANPTFPNPAIAAPTLKAFNNSLRFIRNSGTSQRNFRPVCFQRKQFNDLSLEEYFNVCAVAPSVMSEERAELRITGVGVHVEGIEVIQDVEGAHGKPHAVLAGNFEVPKHSFIQRYISPLPRCVT